MRLYTIFRSALVAALAASANAAIQFDASFGPSLETNGDDVVSWVSTSGEAAIHPCHGATNGWTLARIAENGVDFSGTPAGVATPLCFQDSATGMVGRVFAVADCVAPSALSTIVDAPVPVRVSAPLFDADGFKVEATNALGAAYVELDGVQDGAVGAGRHVVEVAFDDPCEMRGIFIGGCPATPAWHRSWNGTIREVVLLPPGATGEELATVRAYLAKKWDMARRPSGLANELFIAKRLGLRVGSLYGSVLMVR